jgi:hypothetical protein
MNRVQIQLLIADIRTLEREIIKSSDLSDEQDLLSDLKTAVDDLRTTIWSSLVQSAKVDEVDRIRFIQMVRMQRVVEMLRGLGRERSTLVGQNKSGLKFADLVNIAESATKTAEAASLSRFRAVS